MTIKEKYDAINESFDDVLSRLVKEERIERFAKAFFTTGDFEALEKCVQEKDISNVFEYSHKIKGNSLSIGFANLSKITDELTEFTRPREISDYDKMNELFAAVKKEYEMVRKVFED